MAEILKRCSVCLSEKSYNSFYGCKGAKDGKQYECKDCFSVRRRDDSRRNPGKYTKQRRRWAIRATYGLTLEQYNNMLLEQDNKCACCGGPPGNRDFHIDHNHVTGNVRGLLCHHCNVAIGFVNEDPKRLDQLKDYLEKHMQVGIGV